MKQYKKDGQIKLANQIVATVEGISFINSSEEQILAAGWEEYTYIPPEPTEPEPVLTPSSYAVNEAISFMMLPKMKEEFKTLDDQEALQVMALADTWYEMIGEQVNVGDRLFYDNKLWKVKQEHTVQEQWKPGLETASLYEVIDVEHAGTLEDPIPYTPPMEIFVDKYYSQNGSIYKCTRNSEIALSQNLLELVGLYVELIK